MVKILKFGHRRIIASNAHCKTDMQCFTRTGNIFVAGYVVITYHETRDVSTCMAGHHTVQLATDLSVC